MQLIKETLKKYENGGKIEVYSSVDRNANDFEKIYSCCDFFAKKGEITVITPKVHHKDVQYNEIYNSLMDTRKE